MRTGEGRGIYSVAMFHVGAKSALLRRFFMLMRKKASSARSLAPPLQITTACAGLRFGFGCRPGGMSSKLFPLSTSEQALYRLLRLFYKSQSALILPLFPLSTSQLFAPGCEMLLRCSAWSQSLLCGHAFLCARTKSCRLRRKSYLAAKSGLRAISYFDYAP